MHRTADSIAEVVTSGLCIGCGLCETVTQGRIPMVMTPTGSLRPTPVERFSPEEEAAVLTACPGVVAAPHQTPDLKADPVWGAFSTMRYGWAGDSKVRFRAATGGVLTALGMHLIDAGTVDTVLHVGADPKRPMRSHWALSQTAEEVLANTGSRYGPTAPLAGLDVVFGLVPAEAHGAMVVSAGRHPVAVAGVFVSDQDPYRTVRFRYRRPGVDRHRVEPVIKRFHPQIVELEVPVEARQRGERDIQRLTGFKAPVPMPKDLVGVTPDASARADIDLKGVRPVHPFVDLAGEATNHTIDKQVRASQPFSKRGRRQNCVARWD